MDLDSHRHADVVLCRLMGKAARPVLDREGLPHVGHMICGWGNSWVDGRSLVDRIGDFIIDAGCVPRIPQSCETGDFHPWQSFAYCRMAAIKPTTRAGGHPLNQLILNSHELNTSDETDLGHFLYTIAGLDKRWRPEVVSFSATEMRLNALVSAAIQGHLYGGYQVCRKFHLTEGLCAISVEEDYRVHREIIERLLEGQLYSLRPLLAAIYATIPGAETGKGTHGSQALLDDMLSRLRVALVLGDALENLYYYAGHLIELAAISLQCGFNVATSYAPVINCIVNALNWIIPRVAGRLHFAESFYAFAHYRRGIRLYYSSAGERIQISRIPDASDLDSWSRIPLPAQDSGCIDFARFALAPSKKSPRRELAVVLDAYDRISPRGCETRGEFAHFRKIMPAGFPRGLHFEFLDHGEEIGVELHCENAELDAHLIFKDIVLELNRMSDGYAVFDDRWYHGCGRIVFQPAEKGQPQAVAAAMVKLVELAHPRLVKLFRKV